MSNISKGVHYGYLIYMEDGQVWAADSKKLAVTGRAKWGIGITWRIVDADGKQLAEGRFCHVGFCQDTPWLFKTPKDEIDIGIGDLIAQYYAFKYLKHFPSTLEITFITDRIATFQRIEDYKKRSDSEMPDSSFNRLLPWARFELGQCMQRHGVMIVQHLRYAGYDSKWKADEYARTPERLTEWEHALNNPTRYMPGLPAERTPNDAINETANVYFLNKKPLKDNTSCLGEVTLVLDGAYGSYRRKADFIDSTIRDERARGFRGDVH